MATFVELETACGPVTVNADLVSIVRKCNESKCYVWFGEDDPMIICEPYEAVKGKIHAACEARNGKHLCASASLRETDAGSAGPVKEEKEEYEQREADLFELADLTELAHLDLTLLFGGEELHDRRLDDRHQRHVGIGSHRDGA